MPMGAVMGVNMRWSVLAILLLGCTPEECRNHPECMIDARTCNAGCVERAEEGEPEPPECESHSDCDADEICDEGSCEDATCEELVDSDKFSCERFAELRCTDDGELACFCTSGTVNFRGQGCEDPTGIYASCCGCLSANGCLSTSENQCNQALVAGAEVGTETYCATDECPGACAYVLCDAVGCEGY